MRRTFRTALRSALYIAAISAGACTEPADLGCRDFASAGNYEEAASVCERQYADGQDPVAGALAARAQYFLGDYDAVEEWSKRLVGTPDHWTVEELRAAILRTRGELDAARDLYLHLLRDATERGDAASEARSQYALFYLAWQQSDYGTALDRAALTIRAAREAKDPSLESRAAGGLYSVLYSIGDLQGAQRALDDADRAASQGATDDERARLLYQRSLLHLDSGQPALARHQLERALELATEEAVAVFFRAAHLNFARIALDSGETELAASHLASAAKYLDDSPDQSSALAFYSAQLDLLEGNPGAAADKLREELAKEPVADWRWDLEQLLGTTEKERGQGPEAVAAWERSIEIVEELRRDVGLDDYKVWLLAARRKPFEALFEHHAETDRRLEALSAADRAKARTLVDALLRVASDGGSRPDGQAESASQRWSGLSTLLPALESSPLLGAHDPEAMLQTLGASHALLYFTRGERVWGMRLAEEALALTRIEASVSALEAEIDRWWVSPDDPDVAERLAEWLLPLALRSAEGTPLVIISDGVLDRLPFAALRIDGRYLAETHAISYMPSLSALGALAETRSPSSGPPRVLADPLGDLPSAAEEGSEFRERLGGIATIGPDADREALEAARRAPILHLATHSGLSARGPTLTLSDGEVSAAELIEKRVAPQLVVLATCASAAHSGQGIWGSLGGAFLAAGSQHVLATLGSVEDQEARELTALFYAEGGASDPAAALAKAQQHLIRAGRRASAWAPYVVLGAARPEGDLISRENFE